MIHCIIKILFDYVNVFAGLNRNLGPAQFVDK